MDLRLNYRQRLICHKNPTNQLKHIVFVALRNIGLIRDRIASLYKPSHITCRRGVVTANSGGPMAKVLDLWP